LASAAIQLGTTATNSGMPGTERTSRAWAPSKRRRTTVGTGARLGHPRFQRLDELHRLDDAALELGVEPLRVVLGPDLDLDVGIGPVSLDGEAAVPEPVGELGLGRDRAVDERVPRPDADDAAHVRFPISGPSRYCLKLWEKMSPSEPECSLVSPTTGPAGDSIGYGVGSPQRCRSYPMRFLATFSSSNCETCPPRL